ncbi:MAG: UbiX family flavin prenyltransferase [Synergistales bacterium]|nr:UbiX family flavin prenyltransferase [Synergistales bacterium]
MRIVIASTGASGQCFFIKLLEQLHSLDVETHVILSDWGLWTLKHETGLEKTDVANLCHRIHAAEDLSAAPASGSYPHDGMVVLPCSMKTLAAIASSFADNLITRAADVTLKERRNLLLCPRETPLHEIHLEHMLRLSRMGALIMPPLPGFYGKPGTLEEFVEQFTGRVLDQLGIANSYVTRWDPNPGNPDRGPSLP